MKDPSKLKVSIGFQKYTFLAIFGLSSRLKYSHFRRHIVSSAQAKKTFAHEIAAICAT